MTFSVAKNTLVSAPLEALSTACFRISSQSGRLAKMAAVAVPSALTLGCSGDPALMAFGGTALAAGTAAAYLALRSQRNDAQTESVTSSFTSEAPK